MIKRLSTVRLLACLLAVGFAGRALAQQPAQPVPTSIRIIDLKKVFDKHARFQAATKMLKDEVTAREGDLKGYKDKMEAVARSLQTFAAGSPDRKRLEGDLIRMDSDLKAQLTLGRREFLDKESKIYLDVYKEVLDEVKFYCQYHGVSLVMRYNGESIDEIKDPDGVMKELNKSVIYYNGQIDITDPIVNELNRRFIGPGPGPGVAPQPGPTANNNGTTLPRR